MLGLHAAVDKLKYLSYFHEFPSVSHSTRHFINKVSTYSNVFRDNIQLFSHSLTRFFFERYGNRFFYIKLTKYCALVCFLEQNTKFRYFTVHKRIFKLIINAPAKRNKNVKYVPKLFMPSSETFCLTFYLISIGRVCYINQHLTFWQSILNGSSVN